MITTALLGGDGWGFAEEADRRFRRICTEVGIPILILALILPWLKLMIQQPPEKNPDIVQYAELLPEQSAAASQGEQTSPSPQSAKPQEAAPAEKQPAAKQPVSPNRTAREIAEQSGLLQMRDQLADMRNQNLSSVTSQQPLASGTPSSGDASASSASAVAAGAAYGSGGIGNAGNASVTSSQNGAGLGTRHTGDVQDPGGGQGQSNNGRKGDRPAAGRTLEEIQLTFDRSKSAFFAIFNRVTRENAGMGAGKVVVNLMIAPDGSVTRCEIVSSSFSNPELEQKILLRVKMLNFGAKDVPPFFFPNYPIDFIPS